MKLTEAYVRDFTNVYFLTLLLIFTVSPTPSFGNDQALTFVQNHGGLFGQGGAYQFCSLVMLTDKEKIFEETE